MQRNPAPDALGRQSEQGKREAGHPKRASNIANSALEPRKAGLKSTNRHASHEPVVDYNKCAGGHVLAPCSSPNRWQDRRRAVLLFRTRARHANGSHPLPRLRHSKAKLSPQSAEHACPEIEWLEARPHWHAKRSERDGRGRQAPAQPLAPARGGSHKQALPPLDWSGLYMLIGFRLPFLGSQSQPVTMHMCSSEKGLRARRFQRYPP